jgi:hypothetical protein
MRIVVVHPKSPNGMVVYSTHPIAINLKKKINKFLYKNTEDIQHC